MKNILITIIVLVTGSASAAGYSSWAVPEEIELVNNGLFVKGNFGDSNACGQAGYVYISQDDITFDRKMSFVLSALHAKREMRFWVAECVAVTFHWSGNVINQNLSNQPAYIR